MPDISTTKEPKIGTFFPLEVRNLIPLAKGTLVLTTNGSNMRGQPLPLDLGFLGMPNCTAYANLDDRGPLGTFTAGASGDLQLVLPIPNDANLIGVEVFFQYTTSDPINAMGLVVSNGVRVVLGR